MSIRDEEIKRLEQYAKGLGLRVEFRQHTKGKPSAALYSYEGVAEKIIIYLWSWKSKMQVELDFIHELAHHLAWVHRGRTDPPGLIDALTEEDAGVEISKEKRRLIYQGEKNDAEFREIIVHELGLKIPEHKLKVDKDLDIWIYKYYYRTGKWPNRAQTRKKRKELRNKYADQIS